MDLFQFLADVVLTVHFLFVAFVIFALVFTLIGGYLKWTWVRNWWFRFVHLVAISIVVAQSWFGVICPLTTLEMWLRRQIGDDQYAGSFVQYWLERILYYQAENWVFTLVYTLFGLLVVVTWIFFPPGKRVSNFKQ